MKSTESDVHSRFKRFYLLHWDVILSVIFCPFWKTFFLYTTKTQFVMHYNLQVLCTKS